MSGEDHHPSELEPERPSLTFSNNSGILRTMSPITHFRLFLKRIALLRTKNLEKLRRMQKLSKKRKYEYIEKKIKENPINFPYNPKNSSRFNECADPTQAEQRDKAKLAYRISRYKKKLEEQTKSFSIEFDMMEYRELCEEEIAITPFIQYMEAECERAGIHKSLLEIQRIFGLK